MLKKIFRTTSKTIGNVIAAAFFVYVGFLLATKDASHNFDKENSAKTKEFFSAYAENWDRDDAKKYLHPELYNVLGQSGIKKSLEELYLLGNFKKINSLFMTQYKQNENGSEFAVFTGVADFNNSLADIRIELIDFGSKVFVTKFKVIPQTDLKNEVVDSTI
tara:strand:- start:211 stop:696 length:486 start_codon:yes stop_codon:yes gene_type:complete